MKEPRKFYPYEPSPDYDETSGKQKQLEDTLALYQPKATLRTDRRWLIYDHRIWRRDGGSRHYSYHEIPGHPSNYKCAQKYYVPASCLSLRWWWTFDQHAQEYVYKERPTKLEY